MRNMRWAGLCLMLMMVWMLLPTAQGANLEDGVLPNLTGHTTIGIETVGPSTPQDWYDFTITVQDEEGNLLEGVIVRLYPVLSDGTLGAAITGADGRYMTDENGQLKYWIPPPGGQYVLKTEFGGYENYSSQQFQIITAEAQGTMVVTLKKLPDGDQNPPAGGDQDPPATGDQNPPATGDQNDLYWYTLLFMAAGVAVGLGRLWCLRREKVKQTVESHRTGK